MNEVFDLEGAQAAARVAAEEARSAEARASGQYLELGVHTLTIDGRTYWPVVCGAHSFYRPTGFVPDERVAAAAPGEVTDYGPGFQPDCDTCCGLAYETVLHARRIRAGV